MKLTLDGELRTLQPLADFVAEQGLPPVFGVPLFAAAPLPHSQIWHTRTADLEQIKRQMATQLPLRITMDNLTQVPQMMTMLLHSSLLGLGEQTDLTLEEVAFTADDFRNVLEPVAYKLVQLSYTNQHDKAAVRQQFDMAAVYQEVLDSAIFINEETQQYEHRGAIWQVQCLSSVYGNIGLVVTTAEGYKHYIEDRQHAFPGIPFVAELSQAIGTAVMDHFTQ